MRMAGDGRGRLAGASHDPGRQNPEGLAGSRRVLVAFVLALLVGAVGVASPAGAGTSKKCTITGTNHAEKLRGTNGPDLICARGGDDRVLALNGKDLIRAGGGDDRVKAGAGKDTLAGGGGNDLLFGEENTDELDGGPGIDHLDGGPGGDGCENDDLEDVIDTNCVSEYSIGRLEIAPAAIPASAEPQQLQIIVELEEVENWHGTLLRIYVNEEYAFGEPDFAQIYFPNPYPQLSLVSGTSESGVWTGTYTVPAGTEAAPHTLALLLADGQPPDPLISTQILSAYDLMQAGLPFGFLAVP
jgi:hypothetical protein